MPSIPPAGLGAAEGTISAALSRQLRVTLLMLCWSFSFHAVSRCRRDALQALPDLQAREQKQLKMRLEAPKSSAHGSEAA